METSEWPNECVDGLISGISQTNVWTDQLMNGPIGGPIN